MWMIRKLFVTNIEDVHWFVMGHGVQLNLGTYYMSNRRLNG